MRQPEKGVFRPRTPAPTREIFERLYAAISQHGRAKALLELQRHRRDYFAHRVSHLAVAFFFTSCRFN